MALPAEYGGNGDLQRVRTGERSANYRNRVLETICFEAQPEERRLQVENAGGGRSRKIVDHDGSGIEVVSADRGRARERNRRSGIVCREVHRPAVERRRTGIDEAYGIQARGRRR